MARVIMIAGAALALVAACPADLDGQLIAATGCGLTEIDTLLGAGPDRAALTLMPLLDGEMELSDLAGMIASDPAAIGEIRDLYQSLPPLVLTLATASTSAEAIGAGDTVAIADPPPTDPPSVEPADVTPSDEVPE